MGEGKHSTVGRLDLPLSSPLCLDSEIHKGFSGFFLPIEVGQDDTSGLELGLFFPPGK